MLGYVEIVKIYFKNKFIFSFKARRGLPRRLVQEKLRAVLVSRNLTPFSVSQRGV